MRDPSPCGSPSAIGVPRRSCVGGHTMSVGDVTSVWGRRRKLASVADARRGGEIERPWSMQKGGVNHGRGTQSHPRVLPAGGPAWAWAAASEGCSSDQGSGWQQCSVRLSCAFQRGQGGGRCVQPTTCGPSRAASRTSRCSRRSMRAASRGRAAARSKPSKKTEVQFPSRVPLVVFRAHQTRAHEHQKHGRQHGASATRICSSP